MTDEEKAQARAAKKEAKVKALETLKELADSYGEQYVEALKTVAPSLYREKKLRVSKPKLFHEVVNTIVSAAQISEEDLFRQFKIGRKEASVLIKKHLKASEPSNRHWINFNSNNGMYKHIGTGENPPPEYEGYIPVDEFIDIEGTPADKKKSGLFGG